MNGKSGNLLVQTNCEHVLIVPLTKFCLLSVAHNMANLELSDLQVKPI